MGKDELNKMVLRYQRTGREDLFLEVYLTIRKQFDPFMHVTAKKLGTDSNEILSLVHETMLRTVNQYSGDHDFEHFFNKSFRNAKRDFIRKKKNRERYELVNSDLIKESGRAYSIVAEEDTPISLVKEQRKIISFLIERVEEPTTRSIIHFFPQYDSVTALGRALGLHHETIKRKLRRLSQGYDENRFGKITDYLS
ncbi:hypothetical protein [Bacillus horti]|uniref:DNA-directed RNA polymerase specialized sigma24 family protein n=1 Tax=Caldalkalibacillus horti TaxID=77523 RepID=A0ABT9W050_9BACI|nr:hypothetical protein [Bacillus horti]MDQ0166630.1 DNA-directed RNA polymerase specialized sigma24 family protein [Bacillus horti]